MPLYPGALELIRVQLQTISQGIKPRLIAVGVLTPEQLHAINDHRQEMELPPIVAEILFDGRHLYKSRCVSDGYTIDDVLLQISSAFSEGSQVRPGRATVMVNPTTRLDRNGNSINDEVVFECTARHPHPELFSVVPRGDGKNHTKTKKATP